MTLEEQQQRREREIAAETADLIAESASEDAPALIASALRRWRVELRTSGRRQPHDRAASGSHV